MTAEIIAFSAQPRRSAASSYRDTPISAAALAGKFADHFVPVVQASVGLLEAGEQEFEARCRQMLAANGGTMVEDLCAEIETVGRQMRLLADGLDLTRARLRTARMKLTPIAEAGGDTA